MNPSPHCIGFVAGRRLVWLLLGLACGSAGRPAYAGSVWAVPAGHEQVFLDAFKSAAKEAGCRLDGVSIQRQHADAQLTCGGHAVRVVVHHRDQAPRGAVEIGDLAIEFGPGANDVLRAAVRRVAAGPLAAIPWVEVEAGAADGAGTSSGRGGASPAAAEATAPLPPLADHLELGPDGKPVPPDIVAEYRRGLDLYRQGKHREALDVFVNLARKRPRYGGVLALVVANLAPLQPTAARVEELAREADAHPDDPLRQFIAGVAAHYSAHYRARTPEEKIALYRKCIEYLERCRKAYAFEPRVYIYLAVSHYRLGHQKQAEQLIERAAELSAEDPDVFYCRAEIYHRKDPRRALADLDRYLAMIDAHRQRGGVVPKRKVQRVALLRRYVQAIADGKGPDDEIFDPLQPADASRGAGGPTQADTARPWLVIALVAVAILATAGSAWFRAHRAS